MRGRVGVVALVVGLFAAGLAASAIRAGSTAPPTTTEETTEAATQETTTTVPTSTGTTTAPSPTTTTIPATVGKTIMAAPAPAGCLVVAAFALLEPGRPLLVLGRAADAKRTRNVAARSVAYPADGSVVRASSVDLHAAGCADRGNGRADVRSISLFGGAITARRVELGVRGGVAGKGVEIAGLAIGGKNVTLRPRRQVRVQDWGSAVAFAQPDRAQAGALAVHLSKAHAGLPPGTVLLVSFARLPEQKSATPRNSSATKSQRAVPTQREQRRAKAPKRQRPHARKHHLGDDPLTVTPGLGIGRYVFPVAGESSYVDTYGAFRGDVPGNWHHGDDIFAAVGTPVVAVADGTLNRVGWEHLGGWRLWVRDSVRNEFYYAHLSGYSPLALHSKHVHAGDVIGFIGNTGDAFTTSPHLHFEIHPHQLLQLDYNGAVNPTGYLDAWQHLKAQRVPVPAHPPFPPGAMRAETRYVWRQLLSARGLISHAPKLSERPRIRVPHTDVAREPRRVAAAAIPRTEHRSDAPVVDVLAGLIAPAAAFGLTLLIRLRRQPS